MTCGEAPYLVSRYNVVTGESISVSDRIGLIDRKLRVVSENCDDPKEWFDGAVMSYKSTYGFVDTRKINIFVVKQLNQNKNES